MDSYNAFARFYEELMEDAEYSRRADYILEISRRYNHEPGVTLDLACGTGSLTRELANRGVEVFGVDASVEMLSQAASLNYEKGFNILYLNQNMSGLDLAEKIDTCVCTLDSINHLTDKTDVINTFMGVSRFMSIGGLFIFDVNTVYKHRHVLADNAFVIENEHVFCAWQNFLDEDNVVNIYLDFFEKKNGAYNRYSEQFSERAYSDAELKEMLSQAGFSVEAVLGDLSFDPPSETEQRAIYIAKKI